MHTQSVYRSRLLWKFSSQLGYNSRNLLLLIRFRGDAMTRKLILMTTLVSSAFVHLPSAQAQIFTVQEPTLETFGVATSVSVPDRGRTSLGGVGRSASSRSMYGGPFRSGTNTGLSTQGTSVGVHAYIHDLPGMDRALLGSANAGRDDFRTSPMARHAYETLTTRRNVQDATIAAPGAIEPRMPAAPSGRSAGTAEGPSAAKLLDRAKQAEAEGKRALALTYLRAAHGQGSVEARQQIERLSHRPR